MATSVDVGDDGRGGHNLIIRTSGGVSRQLNEGALNIELIRVMGEYIKNKTYRPVKVFP